MVKPMCCEEEVEDSRPSAPDGASSVSKASTAVAFAKATALGCTNKAKATAWAAVATGR